MTSFTIAHSITLALSSFGILQAPSRLIEPGIAASIVLMAVLHLKFPDSERRFSTRARIAVVFGCGLLHGLGFASAIGAMAVGTGNRLATLAGFNVGIEIGQFLFVAGVMLLVVLARRLVKVPRLALPTAASVMAAEEGVVLLIGRLAPLM